MLSKLFRFYYSFLTSNHDSMMNQLAYNNLSIVKNVILHSFEINTQTDIMYTEFQRLSIE